MLPVFVVERLRQDVPRAATRVLDVGCGSGRYLPLLRELCPHAKVSGVDRYVAAEGVTPGDAHALDVPDGSIDVVTMIEVIEHLERPAVAIAEVARVLKPSGVLCIITPNYPWKRAFDVVAAIKQRSWSRLRDDPTHISPLSTRDLIRLVSAHLFIQVVVGTAVLGEGVIPWLGRLRRSSLGPTISNKTYVLARKLVYA